MAERFYHELMEEVKKQFTEEELAGLTIDLQTVQKQNHQELIGLSMRQEGSNVSPCIYMNEAKMRYEHGESMSVLAAELKRAYMDSLSMIPPARMLEVDLHDFDKIKDQITMRLLEIRRNEKFLEDKPYLDVGNGLALVCDIRIKQAEGDFFSAVVNDQMLEKFGCSENELIQQALDNAWENNTPRLHSMKMKLIPGLGGADTGIPLREAQPIPPEEKEEMYVLSNDEMTMGAASLYAPFVQKQISQVLDEGYYVLPSSIHEVLIVPESAGVDAQKLCFMVREANQSVVSDKDVLSDFVYHYDRETGTLQTVVSTEQPFLLSLTDLNNASLWIENRTDYEQALKEAVRETLEVAMEDMYREGKTQVPFGKIANSAKKEAAADPMLQESMKYCLENSPSLKLKIDAGQLMRVDQAGIDDLKKIFRSEIGLPKEQEVSHEKTAIRDRGEEIA